MGFKRYTLALLTLFLLVLTFVPVLNWIVDPFWYFRNLALPGFNQIKPSYHLYERQVKSALVAKLQPQAVILGSSYAEIGLPPNHAGFTNDGRFSSFNLALPWAHGAELYCYTLFALRQPGLKRLVLGGFDLAESPCSKYQNLGNVDYGNLLLSKAAFKASVETLRGQSGRQLSSADGTWTYKRYVDTYRSDDDVAMSFTESLKVRPCPSPRRGRSLDYGLIDHSRPPADATTAGLRNIIRLARQHNVQLILIDFPKHVLHYEQERECGRLEAYWSRLWQIASVVEEEAGPDARDIEFWSFVAYREINAERVHAGIAMRDRMWQDDGHFNPEVGKLAFDAIFGPHSAFGYRVRTRDFDRIVAASEDERQAFLAKNPWVHEELDQLRQLAGRTGPAAGR